MPRKLIPVNFRAPPEVMSDLALLRKRLRLKDNSKVLRFCITYTVACMEKLDEETLTEALGLAVAQALFENGGEEGRAKT